MKKTNIIIASIAAISIASTAKAETRGHYAGIDLVQNEVTFEPDLIGVGKFSASKLGFGVKYGYAFAATENIFFAPEIFFENVGAEANDVDGDPAKINYMYGLKTNLGYDFNDSFATYLSAGLSAIDYEINWNSTTPKQTISGTELGYNFGIGANYKITSSLALNTALELTEASLKGPINTQTRYRTSITSIKLGLKYSF